MFSCLLEDVSERKGPKYVSLISLSNMCIIPDDKVVRRPIVSGRQNSTPLNSLSHFSITDKKKLTRCFSFLVPFAVFRTSMIHMTARCNSLATNVVHL